MSLSATQVSHVQIGSDGLGAELAVPARVKGLVAFAQRNGVADARASQRFVLAVLQRHGLATLHPDLSAETRDAARRGGMSWTDRILEALAWLRQHERWERVGLLATGAEAAAALQAAATRPASVNAIVIGAADVDLGALRPLRVRAPTLLIVGGRDDELLPRNRELLRQLQCEKRLEVVPGASRRFKEPGALDAMAQMAARWFLDHTDAVAAA